MEDRRDARRRYPDRATCRSRDRASYGYFASDSTGEGSVYAVWSTGKRRYGFGRVSDIESDPDSCPTGTFEILIGLAAFMEWARKFYRFEVKTISEAEIARIADRFTKWDT